MWSSRVLRLWNCKCRKILIDRLVEKCSENIDEKELHSNDMISVTSNNYQRVCVQCVHMCGSCRMHLVLLVMFCIISVSISCAFSYFYWYLKKSNTCLTNINPSTEKVIYWMQLYQTYKWEKSKK